MTRPIEGSGDSADGGELAYTLRIGARDVSRDASKEASSPAALVAAASDDDGEAGAVDPVRLVAAHREAARFYRGLLIDPYVGWPREHLQTRGLGHVLEPGSRWEVGYAPAPASSSSASSSSWTVLVEHLRRRGFGVDELDASGLVTRTHRGDRVDRFRDRIVLPVRDPAGRPVGFVGRARPGAPKQVPKYINTPGTAIYRKAELLFGLGEQRDQFEAGAVPVIVEGPMDVLAVDATAGPARAVRAAVAPCGTSLTAAQVTVLRNTTRSDMDTVLVATDADPAGRSAAARAFELLHPHFRTILAPTLPDGTDPADIVAGIEGVAGGHGAPALRAALGRAVPLVRRLIDVEIDQWDHVLDHLDGQLGALRAVAPLVARLPRRQVARQVTWLSRRVGLDHELITEVLIDAISNPASSRPAAATEPNRPARRRPRTPSQSALRAGVDSEPIRRPVDEPITWRL